MTLLTCTNTILQSSQNMTSAIDELLLYSETVKVTPNSAIFPHEAAAIFYKDDIDKLTKQLSTFRNYKELLLLDKKIVTFSKKFPPNFKAVVALQKQEASTLFAYANTLMEKKAFNTAKKLIKRGNALLKTLQNNDAV